MGPFGAAPLVSAASLALVRARGPAAEACPRPWSDPPAAAAAAVVASTSVAPAGDDASKPGCASDPATAARCAAGTVVPHAARQAATTTPLTARAADLVIAPLFIDDNE
jgi:hypothetical protein